jgi:dTDP-4-amino-4,6-dideoxygalactose transaminase
VIPVVDLAAQQRELQSELDAAIARVSASLAFIGGEEVAGFEREFAAYVGVAHAIGVANGTDALELALQALAVGPGDTVATVPFTFAASLEAIVRSGATPVLVDIRADDFTIDVDALDEVLRRQAVKALIVVHLYGQPAAMEALLALTRRHGVAVIEDSAQAHGAWMAVDGTRQRAGSAGDIGCFSFYPTKNLGAMGDAGAVVTDRPDLAERVRLIACHGERGKYQHVIGNGRNSRLDGLQAAVLRVKLRRLEQWNQARRHAAQHYAEILQGLPLFLPHVRPDNDHVYHQYVVRVARRDAVRAALASDGVGTAVHYPYALHQQPGFRAYGAPGQFPAAEQCAAEVLSLPMSPHLSHDTQASVAISLQHATTQLR